MCLCWTVGGSEAGAGGEVEEWNESGSSTEQENMGTELFWLDYQADSGHLTSFIVYKAGDPVVIKNEKRGGVKHCKKKGPYYVQFVLKLGHLRIEDLLSFGSETLRDA